MKRNPNTKIKVGDNSPVMKCRTIRRRKMNGSADSEAWGVGVTLVPQEKIDIDEMGATSQQRCTVTQADVKAAWSMMEVIIADALANGRRVELGELGILSLEVRAKHLKEPGQRLRGSDVEVGSISLKPGPLLQKQLSRVTFKVDNDCSEPTDAESLDMALYKYFGEDGHEGITVTRFGHLCGYKETAARALLKEYIAQGVMERVPMSRGYYRPTKGNFGW
jgi:nucleoid DNA-binding protein